MKTFSLIMKILSALLAVAGVIYIVATYGDKIVAWFKKLLRKAKPVYSNKRDFDCEYSEDFAEEEASEDEEFEE